MNFLLEAFRQSLYAIGNSDPNPPVGAIIIDVSGQIIGKGYTQVPGQAHAEVMAIEDARKNFGAQSLVGASLYVTLEPCSHYGRTPPCTNAILDSKIGRVYIAVHDSTEKIEGAEILRSKNVYVEISNKKEFAEELFWTIDSFHFYETFKRPRTFLKWAQSSEGWLGPLTGASGPISGALSREIIFRMRKMLHSILVTPGTIIADRPRLTPRYGEVTLKGQLKSGYFSEILMAFEKEYPESSRQNQKRIFMLPDFSANWSREDLQYYIMMQNELPGKAFFIVNNEAAFTLLEKEGFAVHFQRDYANLQEILDYIYSKGTLNLMIEAGPCFAELFFKTGLIDGLIASRSKFSKWDAGRGFSASAALSSSNMSFFQSLGYEKIQEIELETDDFFVFKKLRNL